LERQEEGARPCEEQDTQDLLCRIRGRADRIRAEDGQRLLLPEAFAELFRGREGATEDNATDSAEEPARRRERDVRGGLGDERAGANVAEVGSVRTLDPDAPVRRFAAPQGSPPSDHMDSVCAVGVVVLGGGGQWPRR